MEHCIENGSNPPILLRSSLINILGLCHFCNKRTPLINAVINPFCHNLSSYLFKNKFLNPGWSQFQIGLEAPVLLNIC